MNVVETALIFAGIPLAVIAIVALAVYGRGEVGQRNRYRPGRPWVYAPVWYLPRTLDNAHAPSRALAHEVVEGREHQLALTARTPDTHAAGGASGEW